MGWRCDGCHGVLCASDGEMAVLGEMVGLGLNRWVFHSGGSDDGSDVRKVMR